ncbi:Tail specific protease domain-containing protein [Madurella fahalii]|uniref:Tail specific protease domain-containing protein n=1 Tax=Madurella fahalii TaxID=1157608 RepID=A0ABQ0GJI4_9PEZI
MSITILKWIAAAVLAGALEFSNAYPLGSHKRSGHEPCGKIRDQVAKWMADNNIVPKEIDPPLLERIIPAVPAAPIQPSLAFACLKSIPLHADTALEHVDYLHPLFEWQSTIDYLREPPRGYLSEAADLLGGLEDIATTIQADTTKYFSEFDYLADLYSLTALRVREAHFHYSTLLFDLFTFQMGVKFLSISDDGLATPNIYLYDDVNHTQHGYTPSPVSTINGVPAVDFLLRASVNSPGSHDPDARFNTLFPSLAKDANIGYVHPDVFLLGLDDTTMVECRNGTVLRFSNTAFVRANFTNVTSAAALYQEFGESSGQALMPLPWGFYVAAEKNYTASPNGYPKPIVANPGELVEGFLSDMDEVAVLAVHSFAANINPNDLLAIIDAPEKFNNATVDFIRKAKADGRTKLILDMQSNGGGFMQNLAMLYFNLFPTSGDIIPVLWQARAHPQLEWLGRSLNNDSTGQAPVDLPWPISDNMYVQPDGSPWDSFASFYGPRSGAHGVGNFTNPSMLNTTNILGPNRTVPWTEPPFKPEDIVILTDGECASACAILVDILTHAHGIRTVAVGGRPLQAPMQAVGQTRGGPVGSFSTFPDDVDRAAAPEGLELVPVAPPPLRVTSNVQWADRLQFNLANTLPLGELGEEGEDKKVPMQFRYTAANCRLFFTWEMARDITALWRAVAEVAWGGGKCVPGSTVNEDGTMGDGTVGYTGEVEDKYKLPRGAGSV